MQPVFCGIDFGTSNSSVGVSHGGEARLVPLEGDHTTMPSAIFFDYETGGTLFGRAAVNAYAEGENGRLMRALKSILGSALIHEKTYIRARPMTFFDIVGAYFAYLKVKLEHIAGRPVNDIVLGRPVRFVDDNDAADRAAEETLATVARTQGFGNIAFQFEPIAAALDYERSVLREELVLIVDIGGGTSDFSVVRLSPERRGQADRQGDILANAGVHIGGTDFDRLLSLAQLMPHFGFKSLTADGKRHLPSGYFHDLATWHSINTLYAKKIAGELREVRYEAGRRDLVDRLIRVVDERRGHALAMAVERAKIELTDAPRAAIGMPFLKDLDSISISQTDFRQAIGQAVERVGQTVERVLADAGVAAGAIHTVFMTGGSSAVPLLRECVAGILPGARVVQGYLLGSVGIGLSLDAQRRFQ
ncbi:MAG: Hsp70 family protein [Aestuariivirgaceae bacterium]|nr:Hsp70 family protein [Aestuariivirgaceae bacterium]